MKVYRIDIENGEYYTLTEKELHNLFTSKQIQAFKNNENTYFYETKYTTRQLTKARKLHDDEEYCYKFEEDHNIAPSVYDILQYLYN